MNPEKTIELMTARLNDAFMPSYLEIIDESHLHAGHAGAQSGKGHFALFISAASLSALNPVKRHQTIYQTLGALMETHIHALSIKVVK